MPHFARPMRRPVLPRWALSAVLLLGAGLLGSGCLSPDDADAPTAPPAPPLFEQHGPERTGIAFSNTLSEHPSPHRNELLYEYFSNGGGVAAGDVNGDGLDDLYFTGNMTYNRLYLNRGGLRFEDVTEAAGVAGRRNTWKTGVSMADVDGDGRLDLYVAYSGDLPMDRRIDELYINLGPDENGIPRFENRAEAYGLANPHSSNQAYFFDPDRDGDLDLFLLTHNVRRTARMDAEGTRQQLAREDPVSGVRFYRNDAQPGAEPRFVDATRAVGLQSSALTYGLGAGVADVDRDGWPDLYVGNDYSPPDFLYMNNGDGTFTDELAGRIGHTSNASMGIDVADLTNDGWPEIVVLDMLAEDNRRQKTLFIPNDRALFDTMVAAGFHHQYMRNTLQLNNGDGTFSEIGQLAGVDATDWSWAALIADLDNDGRKDLYVTNGILHDTIDRDFLAYKSQYVLARRENLTPDDIAHLMEQMPSSALPNYAFRNTGTLRFEDVSTAWQLDAPLTSTGAAYADLDNDGDLDLVTNNIDAPAAVFENRADALAQNGFLQVDLDGDGRNTDGIGAKVMVYTGGELQVLEQMPARGYLSSVSPTLHFGLGQRLGVDSLQVTWPDSRRQTLYDVAANQRLTLHQREAVAEPDPARPAPFVASHPLFTSRPSPLSFEHRMPETIDDFGRQPLLDHAQSLVGPAMAMADVNGDGQADVFIGGGSGQAGALFLQRPDGRFDPAPQPDVEADALREDADAVLFDADGDGDADLYVAGGGYGTFAPDDPALQDRLYVNDGAGRFTRAEDALPAMPSSTGSVAVNDLDGDGDLDLFVGGYTVPGRYPEAARSYLLLNDGRGRFEDATARTAPDLMHVGIVHDALWHDLDADGRDELIVAGAWMPIRVFEPNDANLREVTTRYFEAPVPGLWRTLHVADVNGDGRPDLIAGNLGLNTQLVASPAEPARLYYDDFDADGALDPLLTFYMQGVEYPYVTLDELRRQMPRLAAHFPTYAAYADARLDDITGSARLDEAGRLEAHRLATTLFLGTPDGFEPHALPLEAQLAPVHAVHSADYDGDGAVDLLLAGNEREARIRIGRYDASYGVLLAGDGTGRFTYVPQHASGLSLRGDVRSILELDDTLVFGMSGGPVQAYRMPRP